MKHPTPTLLVGIALFAASPGTLPADQDGTGVPSGPGEQQQHVVTPGPGGKTMEIVAGPGSILGKDELILKEYVDIKFGDSRLQADFVRYTPSTKEAYAEGNVILDQAHARITADSLVYNLETETGTFFDARGYAEPSLYFEAKRVEKISTDEIVLHEATFTACTQPIPYWSFKVGRGLVRLNEYAYLHNLSFKVGRATVFFTPYLVWPVKSERAAGLLFPEFGFSRRSGTVISNAVYWPIRRNMDATFFLDYLSLAGFGNGIEYRYLPSATGSGQLTGYYIHDQVEAQNPRPGVPVNRWVLNEAHRQDFDSGWRFTANANFVSDFDYFLDFTRDLRQSSNAQALTNLFLTRTFGFYALNIRGERRELLGSVFNPTTSTETFTRLIAPAIELRGRRQRIGDTPLFLTLESSLDNFSKGDADVTYQRVDLFPVLSSQLSPVSWLDVNASAGLRDTYYTKSQDAATQTTLDQALNRELFQGGLTVIGPKFSRVFSRPDSSFSTQYKNTIEPTLAYAYSSQVRNQNEVIPFDEVDSQIGEANQLTYAFVTRLFAKRAAGGPDELLYAGPSGAYAGGSFDSLSALRELMRRKQAEQAKPGEEPAPQEEPRKQLSTVEVASLEISQNYSFLRPLVSPALNESTRFGPIQATLRFNPSLRTSIDLRTNYDILFNQFSDASLSANLRSPRRGFLDVTWTTRRDLEGEAELRKGITTSRPFSPNQIGLQGETNLVERKILLGMQVNYDIGDVVPGQPRLRDQRYKLGYNTQCCGIQFEYLNRNYVGTTTNEIRFLINLKGVGNVIDLQSQVGGYTP